MRLKKSAEKTNNIKIMNTFIDISPNPDKREDELEKNDQKDMVQIFKDAQEINRFAKKRTLLLDRVMNKNKGLFSSYIISGLNSKDKKSLGYKNCNGICLVGTSKKTGDNISLLSHENPTEICRTNKETHQLEFTKKGEKFKKDLIKSMKLFLEKTQEGTRDAVLFGGNYFNVSHMNKNLLDVSQIGQHAYFYKEIMKLLLNLINKETGIQGQIISGPSMYAGGSMGVLFDTKNRRMFTIRYSGAHNGSNEEVEMKDIENYRKMLNRTISYKEYLQSKYSDSAYEVLEKDPDTIEIDNQIKKLFAESLFTKKDIDENDRLMIKNIIMENKNVFNLPVSLKEKINIGVCERIRELYQIKKITEERNNSKNTTL